MVFLLHSNDIPLVFVEKHIQSMYVLKNDLGLFDKCVCCINCSFNIDTKILNNWCLVDGDIFTTNNYLNASILYGPPSVQKLFQHVWLWNYPMNNKEAPKPTHSSHCCSLDPIWIHCNIFWISFAWAGVCFQVTLANELHSSTYSFPLCLIMNLDHNW